MIKLIKNELYKIIKKKSFLIILLITFGMIFLNTLVCYKFSDTDEEEIVVYQATITDDKSASQADISFNNSEQLRVQLINKYGSNSWQTYLLNNKYSNFLYEYSYKKDSGTPEEKEYVLKEYEQLIARFDADDWKYYVNEEIKKLENGIISSKETLKSLTSSKEIRELEMSIHELEFDKTRKITMIEENVPYGKNYLYEAITNTSYLPNTFDEYYEIIKEVLPNQSKEDAHRDYNDKLKENEINNYIVKNKVNLNEDNSRSLMIEVFSSNLMFIIIFVVMIAGSIMSNEYSKGTIKGLLIRPYSRTKILLSKFISCLICIVFISLCVVLFQLFWGAIYYSLDSLSIPFVDYSFTTSSIVTMNIFSYLLLNLANYLPMILLLLTLAFAMSTIVGNTSLGLIVPIIGYVMSSVINMLTVAYDVKFLRYFVTANWDFNEYIFGNISQFNGVSLKFSAIICIIYFLIMIVATFVVFKKKNIKNI